MAAVPSISSASIQAVKDPQVRDVLRAMADGIAVRNGDVGNGDQAFLTMADLRGGKGKALVKAISAPLAAAITGSDPGQPLAELANQLRDSIMRSPAWLAMFSRLQAIDAPDTLPGSFAYQLLQEARARQTGIYRVESQVADTNEQLVSTRETLVARLGENTAAIGQERIARVAQGESFAQQLSAIVAETGRSLAGIEQKLTTTANNDNALASAINTIWARVGTNQALVQSGTDIAVNPVGSVATKFDQLQATAEGAAAAAGTANKAIAILREEATVTADTIKGLSGKWGVKIDLDGYVAGLALNSGVTTGGKAESSFLVLADKFAVGAPGKPNAVPFAIDARTGLVAVDGSLVATETISAKQLAAFSVERDKLALKVVGGAQIDDLAVDTLQIKGNAVTIPKVVSRTDEARVLDKWEWLYKDILSTSVTLTQPGHILALVTCSQASRDGDHEWNMSLRIDGLEVAFAGGSSPLDAVALSGARFLQAGTYRVELYRRSNDAIWATNRNMTIFGVMK